MNWSPILATFSASALITGIALAWVTSVGALAWRRMAGAAVAALLGAGVSIYLGIQHHAASGRSICSVSATFDCDAVNRSPWSEVGGIPVAFLGLGFYVAVLGVAALHLLGRQAFGRAPHLVAAGGVLSVVYSVFLAFISAQLGTWCLMCISMYGFNLIILVAAVLEARASGVGLTEGLAEGLRGSEDRSFWTMAALALFSVVVAMAVYGRSGEATASAAAGPGLDLSTLYRATEGPMVLDGTEPILGNPKAKYTIVEFADFQCPSCADSTPEVFALAQSDPDVRVLFKHFPISNLCNDLIQGVRHERSCPAAFATECARQQGKFWEMEKQMMANQAYLEDDDMRFMAEKVGLDIDAWSACLTDPRTAEAIKADVAASQTVGVHFTPSFYLNGIFGPDDWVLVERGPTDLKILIEAHKAGIALPPAGAGFSN